MRKEGLPRACLALGRSDRSGLWHLRVWMTGSNRAPGTPGFCRKGSDNPYAKAFPIDTNQRQLAVFDPKTDRWHEFRGFSLSNEKKIYAFDDSTLQWTPLSE